MNDTLWSDQEFEEFFAANGAIAKEELEEKHKAMGLLKPVDLLVLVKVHKTADKTESGIYIPVDNQGEMIVKSGLVLSFGPNAFRSKKRFPYGPSCYPGQFIAFAPTHTRLFDFFDETVVFVPDISVQGIIMDEEVYRASLKSKGYGV